MINLPMSKEPFRLVAIDPGSSTLGISVLEYNLDGNKFKLIHAETFKVNAKDAKHRSVVAIHGDRTVRLMILRDLILETLNEYQPHAIVAESSYMGRFANAFATLVECMAMIRSAMYSYDPFMLLYMVDPTTVKTNVGMKRIKGTTKEDVKNALLKSNKVQWNDTDPNDLDEHSIDAIAVGCWYMDNVV